MAQDMTLHERAQPHDDAGGERQGGEEAFTRRLANLLHARREHEGLSARQLARRSEGRFLPRELKAFETGSVPVDHGTAVELAALYGADLGDILGDRLPIRVESVGILRTGGVVETFDPTDDDALLAAYLTMVRRLRRQERAEVVDLRRDDVVVLAEHLGVPGVNVVERLGALMGATRARRTSMAALFGAGVAVIGLTTGVAAVATSGGGDPVIQLGPASLPLAPSPDSEVVPGGPEELHDGRGIVVVVPTPSTLAPPATVPDEALDGPADEPVDGPVGATAPPPTQPPATASPPTPAPPTTVPDVVGVPPVPTITSPPPIDTLAPGTPVPTDPPPPIVPPDE